MFTIKIAYQDVLAIDLKVGHEIVRVTEVHGEIAVNIVPTLGTIEETDMQLLGMELVTNLVELVKELSPFLGIIGEGRSPRDYRVSRGGHRRLSRFS